MYPFSLIVSSASNRSSAIFWLIVLAVLALIIGALIWNASRQQKRIAGRLNEMRDGTVDAQRRPYPAGHPDYEAGEYPDEPSPPETPDKADWKY